MLAPEAVTVWTPDRRSDPRVTKDGRRSRDRVVIVGAGLGCPPRCTGGTGRDVTIVGADIPVTRRSPIDSDTFDTGAAMPNWWATRWRRWAIATDRLNWSNSTDLSHAYPTAPTDVHAIRPAWPQRSSR
jgi:hypothetical protein